MLVIGIDGGGTKTTATLMKENGEILAIGEGGPSGITYVPLHVTRNRIFDAVEDAFKKADMQMCRVDAIFAGMGGLVTVEDRTIVNHMLSVLPCYDAKTVVHSSNDIKNALAGGLSGRSGICVVSSTQACAFGTNERHIHHRCGGYGFKEGDAGSAYALGRSCLKLAVRAYDKRVEETKFTKELIKVLGLNHMSDIMNMMNNYYEDRIKTAILSPMVTKYALEGDKHAIEIIEEATNELALCLKGVIDNLVLENKEIAIVGKLANAPGYYERLISKIKEYASDYKIFPMELTPAIGSALIALQLKKIKIDDKVIENAKKFNT